jgi:SAM-dependent methyltransferase
MPDRNRTVSVEYRGQLFEYECDLDRLPTRLAACFRPSELSARARSFVDRAIEGRHGRFVAALHSALRGLASDFDVNGLLGTYPMFLAGRSDFEALLSPAPGACLLDVGAGNGDVTAELAPLFAEVDTMETSWAMARRLRKRGYRCQRRDLSDGEPPEGTWDVVSCLNVIDRSARPRTLLRRAAALLKPNGKLLLASPLPYSPFVYEGGRTLPPLEKLGIRAERWEDALAELCTRELEPLGLRVETFTRCPYLSGGDPQRPLYVLDDAIVLCRPEVVPSSGQAL